MPLPPCRYTVQCCLSSLYLRLRLLCGLVGGLLLLQDNTHLASRLFAALSVEPPGSRTALQEALGAMAGALAGGIQQQGSSSSSGSSGGGSGSSSTVDAAKLQEIEELLMSSIGGDQVGRFGVARSETGDCIALSW